MSVRGNPVDDNTGEQSGGVLRYRYCGMWGDAHRHAVRPSLEVSRDRIVTMLAAAVTTHPWRVAIGPGPRSHRYRAPGSARVKKPGRQFHPGEPSWPCLPSEAGTSYGQQELGIIAVLPGPHRFLVPRVLGARVPIP